MKSFIPVFLLALLSVPFLFSGCSQEDEFATNPMSSLSFSADTLSFDTVFSTLGTPTAWLKIYNTGNRKIKISGISLQSGGATGFHINVDGRTRDITDVEILAKDSLFLFVQLTPPERGANTPYHFRDAIVFQSDDGRKQIILEAYSQDVTIWHSKTITSDTTLTADKPFLIYDSLVVAKGVTLNISEGTTLHFHDQAKVVVYGTLIAKGSAGAPITFRGDRLDDVLPDFAFENYPGQWGSIRLAGSSVENQFDYVHIRGGYSGVVADSSSMDFYKLKMTNSVIHNMVENCLYSNNCKMLIANSQITNSGWNTVELVDGNYDFIHCTIANYQRLITKKGVTLVLANHSPNPFQAGFYNCIVYGNQSSEIDTMMTYPASCTLSFKNCLLCSKVWSSDIASGCLYYPSVPRFLKQGSEDENYQFDFRIDSESDACNMADTVYSNLYPYDLNGLCRQCDRGPDIGAYEWVLSK